ncbi:MAG: hypothetical protein P8P83_04795 [Rickettsiaceae bacterium]|nr:hypothetical protein [Rickettsiaceae bacterium]
MKSCFVYCSGHLAVGNIRPGVIYKSEARAHALHSKKTILGMKEQGGGLLDIKIPNLLINLNAIIIV